VYKQITVALNNKKLSFKVSHYADFLLS